MATSSNDIASTLELLQTDDHVSLAPGQPQSSWDPCQCADWDNEAPTTQCILRIKRDIMTIFNEPPPGIIIIPDKDDITRIHALITGPFDTPYEGGFFCFLIRCPPDYPIRPPRVKLLTTGDKQVRFNPNFYKNGKVCLSILGTWSGPAWSPAQSLSSVLISMQSLMNEKPYHNEPGFEKERNFGDAKRYSDIIRHETLTEGDTGWCRAIQERNFGDAKRYSDIIRHETLRVAVCDMLEGKCPCPQSLQEVMETSFPDYFEYYEAICTKHADMQGQTMQDPFGEKRGVFDFSSILKRLGVLQKDLTDKMDNCSTDETSDMEQS